MARKGVHSSLCPPCNDDNLRLPNNQKQTNQLRQANDPKLTTNPKRTNNLMQASALMPTNDPRLTNNQKQFQHLGVQRRCFRQCIGTCGALVLLRWRRC